MLLDITERDCFLEKVTILSRTASDSKREVEDTCNKGIKLSCVV